MMKYKKHSKFAMFSIVAASLALAFIFLNPVQAKSPVSGKEMDRQMGELLKSVKKGDDLWHSAKLGTNGLACGNCHPDGSASNPHTWPKYQTNLGKVGTLREMINWCILVPMQGQMLDLGGDDMIAMEAYATYTHRGVKIAPAADEQHGAVPVKSGPGYPAK